MTVFILSTFYVPDLLICKELRKLKGVKSLPKVMQLKNVKPKIKPRSF